MYLFCLPGGGAAALLPDIIAITGMLHFVAIMKINRMYYQYNAKYSIFLSVWMDYGQK